MAHEASDQPHGVDRRTFLQATAAAAAGAATWATGAIAQQPGVDRRNVREDVMTYRVLGRTNFLCSRLVFGCGAALAGGKAVRLLERAYETGINFYDVGYDDYYKGAEMHLAPFYAQHREGIWVTSKAPARVAGGDGPLTREAAEGAARYWTGQLDKSLERLKSEHIDAYYAMGVSDPELVRSDELHAAFDAAKQAGKVDHMGISTHENAQECLDAAVDAGWYSLAMIAVTPAGWYDYRANKLLEKGTLRDLQPVLERARKAGVGLVGMKAARYIATEPYGGIYGKIQDDSIVTAFDHLYDTPLLQAGLSPYQRSYAYVLENGLDVVNADMQNFRHFEENLIAARTSRTYFA